MRRRRHSHRRGKNHTVRNIVIGCFVITLFLATGYSAFQTVISLNVKGNIKQKPFNTQKLKQNVVTSGNGLYYDSVIDEYIYKGSNPDNWITFAGEDYRIMNIDSSGGMQIIKNEFTSILYDPGYNTTLAGISPSSSTIGTRYSNDINDYCYFSDDTKYRGCRIWGSNKTMRDSSGNLIASMPQEVNSNLKYNIPNEESYLNIYLNGGTYNGVQIVGWYNTLTNHREKEMVESNYPWKIGMVKNQNGQDIYTDILQEKSYTWNGTVGLMSISDFVKASNNPACESVNAYYTNSSCYDNSENHNWLYKNKVQWTISNNSVSDPSSIWIIKRDGKLDNGWGAYNTSYIEPSIHLKPSVKLIGYGSKEKPYKINKN